MHQAGDGLDEFGRDVITERGPELDAALAAGELEVPARIVTAGASAQGHLVSGESEVRGVVVGSGQLMLHGIVRDEGCEGLGRGGRVVGSDLELALDLNGLTDRHERVVPAQG